MKRALFISALTAGIIGLAGCAAKPVNMILNAPTPLEYSNNLTYMGQNYKVVVQDIRNEKHLLKVIDSDGDAVRHAPGSPIIENLTKSMKQSFQAQGVTVNDYAGAKVILDIVQLETVVEQTALDYEASLSVEFKVTIQYTNNQSFDKTFSGNSTRSGILKYDIALLERDLNALVETVLADIYNDEFIIQAIQT